MSWTPGRSAPPPRPAPPETPVWTLTKTGRSASAHVRQHPLGPELVVRVRSELLWSQVFRPGDVPTLDDVAAEHRAQFIARGWTPAE